MMDELARFKRMYVHGRVSLEVYDAMVEYYLVDCNGDGPTQLGRSIPASVDSDATPANAPEEHPGVAQYLKSVCPPPGNELPDCREGCSEHS
jgi:hypothetical protein